MDAPELGTIWQRFVKGLGAGTVINYTKVQARDRCSAQSSRVQYVWSTVEDGTLDIVLDNLGINDSVDTAMPKMKPGGRTVIIKGIEP